MRIVKHGQPLVSLQEEKELKALFEKHGKVNSLVTKKEWRNSLVTFGYTQHAAAAKEALDGSHFLNERLKIQFTRVTKRVLVRGLLASFSDSAALNLRLKS